MTSISEQAGDGPLILRVFDEQGQLGTITLQDGTLTGSSQGMQDIADAALRRAEQDPQRAMALLEGWSNGYVWAHL